MPRAGSSTTPGALKRYQACHRCRRRKLRADPVNAPSEPSCIYDAPDLKVLGPKARISALESEIAELQDLLRSANDRLAQCTCGAAHIPDAQAFTEISSNSSPLPSGSGLQPPDSALDPEFEFSFPSPAMPNSTRFLPAPPMSTDTFPAQPLDTAGTTYQDSAGIFDLTLNIWPLNIPPPATLLHLVEVFFSSVPLASRLIHKPTFMSNLSQVPTSPNFPHVAVLHAICAMASIYSPIITQPHDAPGGRSRVRLFASGVMKLEDVLDPEPEGFGETHIRWAAESVKPSVRIGDRGLQLLQAAIIIIWYHYSTGKVVPLWTWLGLVTRFAVPIGTNVAEGFEPLSRLPPEMLHVSRALKTPVEAETFRNIFWVTYVTERVCAAGIVWPMNMHEDDISQFMPCRFSDFVSGTFVPLQGRQQLFTDNMLLHHPSLTTDSWTLYIKATVLVSKVRSFNARYRTQSKIRHFNAMIAPTQTEEFQGLDRTISAFVQNIPRAFRQPIGATVDPLLYMAHLVPHVAMIQLHDPHAQLRSPDDYSAMKMLSAAREVLDLIYKLSATSFDVLYLDHACSFGWFLAGATVTRFLTVKMDAQDQEEVSRLTQELAAIKYMLTKLGERTPMGLRQITLLDELYDQLIRERDQAVSEAHGASTQYSRQGSASSSLSTGN